MKMKKNVRMFGIVLVVLAMITSVATAAVYEGELIWSGGGIDNSWDDGANWDPGLLLEIITPAVLGDDPATPEIETDFEITPAVIIPVPAGTLPSIDIVTQIFGSTGSDIQVDSFKDHLAIRVGVRQVAQLIEGRSVLL